MGLAQDQIDELLMQVEKSTFIESICVLGPAPKRSFLELYSILTQLGIGYSAESVDKTKTNDERGDIIIYVTHYQAKKLLEAVSGFSGKTFDEISKGKYVPTPVTDKPYLMTPQFDQKKKEEKKSVSSSPSLNFDFGSLLKM